MWGGQVEQAPCALGAGSREVGGVCLEVQVPHMCPAFPWVLPPRPRCLQVRVCPCAEAAAVGFPPCRDQAPMCPQGCSPGLGSGCPLPHRAPRPPTSCQVGASSHSLTLGHHRLPDAASPARPVESDPMFLRNSWHVPHGVRGQVHEPVRGQGRVCVPPAPVCSVGSLAGPQEGRSPTRPQFELWVLAAQCFSPPPSQLQCSRLFPGGAHKGIAQAQCPRGATPRSLVRDTWPRDDAGCSDVKRSRIPKVSGVAGGRGGGGWRPPTSSAGSPRQVLEPPVSCSGPEGAGPSPAIGDGTVCPPRASTSVTPQRCATAAWAPFPLCGWDYWEPSSV